MPESNLIFVSYANPNLAVVPKIVRFLQTAGLKTWFDKENLLGGQEWEKEIAHAIRSCSLFVVNLSSAAVDRRGVFQKEIRLALDVALTIPHNLVSVLGFKTKRLILKPLSLDDIPSYETHFIDYEVIRHLSAVMPWPYPRNGVSEFFQNVLLPPQGISWGLFLNERPTEVIGCLELLRPGTPENRGFWLPRKYWGRGLMTEAVKPVMDFAFF
jgi:hypothetical protein